MYIVIHFEVMSGDPQGLVRRCLGLQTLTHSQPENHHIHLESRSPSWLLPHAHLECCFQGMRTISQVWLRPFPLLSTPTRACLRPCKGLIITGASQDSCCHTEPLHCHTHKDSISDISLHVCKPKEQ